MKRIIFIIIFMLSNINSMQKANILYFPDEILLSILDHIYFDFKENLKVDNFFEFYRYFSKYGHNGYIKNIRLACKKFDCLLTNYYLNKMTELVPNRIEKLKKEISDKYKKFKRDEIEQKLGLILKYNDLNFKSLKEVSNLLAAGHILDFTLDSYNEILMFASKNHCKSFLDFLIQLKHLNINNVNEEKRTVLMHFVLIRNKDIIKLLINNEKIDINAQDINGDTALILAIKKNDKNMVKLLLESKSIDLKIKNKKKKDALKIAKKLKAKEIIEILSNFKNS